MECPVKQELLAANELLHRNLAFHIKFLADLVHIYTQFMYT